MENKEIKGKFENDVNCCDSYKLIYDDKVRQQLKYIEDMVSEMAERENKLLNTDTLSLYEAIAKLREFGNIFSSWHCIRTNIESIELVVDDNDNYSIEVKTKLK